jgi:hypothetical protein
MRKQEEVGVRKRTVVFPTCCPVAATNNGFIGMMMTHINRDPVKAQDEEGRLSTILLIQGVFNS